MIIGRGRLILEFLTQISDIEQLAIRKVKMCFHYVHLFVFIAE